MFQTVRFILFHSTVNPFVDFWIAMYFAIQEIRVSTEFLSGFFFNLIFTLGPLMSSEMAYVQTHTHTVRQTVARIIYNCFIRFNRELYESVTRRLCPTIFIQFKLFKLNVCLALLSLFSCLLACFCDSVHG